MRFAEVAERDGLAAAVAEFGGQAELLVEQFYRAAEIAVEVFGDSEAAERAGFAAAVADFARDQERLFVEGYRLPVAFQGGVSGPQIAERAGFTAAVCDLARDGQLLIEKISGALGVALRVMRRAQPAEGLRLASAVA